MCATCLALQDRVDGHEHAAGGGGAEDRHDGLDPLVEVDADPVAALEPALPEPGAEGGDVAPQLAVALRDVLKRERRRVRAGGGHVGHELVQLRMHGSVRFPSGLTTTGTRCRGT